jgi:hypothetical protein
VLFKKQHASSHIYKNAVHLIPDPHHRKGGPTHGEQLSCSMHDASISSLAIYDLHKLLKQANMQGERLAATLRMIDLPSSTSRQLLRFSRKAVQ